MEREPDRRRTGRLSRGHCEGAFRRGCARESIRLIHYSIQDDHAHLIVETGGAQALGRGMKSLASLFAFAVNRGLERNARAEPTCRWFEGWRASMPARPTTSAHPRQGAKRARSSGGTTGQASSGVANQRLRLAATQP